MLPLKLGKHGEINHTILVLRERAFGIVVLSDNLFRVGNGLFDRELSETLVPFLQCPDSDGGGFLPVYLYIAKFGFCLPYLYIGLYPAFLLFRFNSSTFWAYSSFLRSKVSTACSYSFAWVNCSFFGASGALGNSLADTL